MCGIHLAVWSPSPCPHCCRFRKMRQQVQEPIDKDEVLRDDENHQSSSSFLLRRRGPNHFDTVSRKGNAAADDGWEFQLSASVLQMRQELQPQPVRLRLLAADNKLPRQEQHRLSSNSNNRNGDKHDDGGVAPKAASSHAYLCWNGEVYQTRKRPRRRQKGGANDQNEDAWGYDVSDTNLVTQLLEEEFNRQERGMATEGHKANDDDTWTPPLTVLQRCTASVLAQLYNAEFAFVLVSDQGDVLFGRDSWGRRSLLLGTCSSDGCGSFQVASVVDANSHPNDTNMVWRELPPGQVHAVSMVDTKLPIEPLDFSSLMEVPRPTLQDFTLTSAPSLDSAVVSTDMLQASLQFEVHLQKAVQMRISGHSNVGVLFSGGVDSVVVAALVAEFLSQETSTSSMTTANNNTTTASFLHLYNVSFGDNVESSADRKAAIVSYHALQTKHQHSSSSRLKIRFHDISIADWETVCSVEPHVRALLYPKTPTVMDINIATALWFAAQGHGIDDNRWRDDGLDGSSHSLNDSPSLKDEQEEQPRVILLGMGADELLGGYGRHRKAYEKGGWEMLQAELRLDQNRIWERNLGRDDRLVSDHGKEARFPFLDAHVVDFLKHQLLSNICNYDLPPGQGDKQILRLLAQRLGMDHASGLVKRAIQFGSRISHLSDKQRFGSRRKAKGESRV